MAGTVTLNISSMGRKQYVQKITKRTLQDKRISKKTRKKFEKGYTIGKIGDFFPLAINSEKNKIGIFGLKKGRNGKIFPFIG